MLIKPDIQRGETYTGAVFECIESAWRGNPILLFEAIRDAVDRGDFPEALVLARELDRQTGLPFRGATGSKDFHHGSRTFTTGARRTPGQTKESNT